MESIDIEDHRYWLDEEGPKISSSLSPPNTLLKFLPLNQYSVTSLISNYLYVAHPWEFNDLYDMMTPPDSNFYLNREEQSRILLQNGLVCMTHPNQLVNPLMWGHYTDFEGFCIEFDYSQITTKYFGPFPINYLKSYPDKKILSNIKTLDLLLRMAVWTNIKHDVWRYENEWRFISYTPEQIYKQPKFLDIKENDLIEREMRFITTGVKHIVLGQKFLLKEMKNTEPSAEGFVISFECELKKTIVDFVIQNKIPCSVLAFDEFNSFRYGLIPIMLEKHNNGYLISKIKS